MTGAELRAARERLGISVDDLSADLGLAAAEYAAFEERPRARLPRSLERQVAYALSQREQWAFMAAGGVPECPIARRLAEEGPQPDAPAEVHTAFLERVEHHFTTCETCVSNARILQERFPNAPGMPLPLSVRVFAGFDGWLKRRPSWARPPIVGALALARDPSRIGMLLGAAVLAALAGAFGGLVYAFVGRPLRRIRGVGPYLAGIVSVAGYLVAIGTMLVIGGDDELTRSPGTSLGFLVFASLIFGSVVGHKMRPRKGGAKE